MRYYICAFCADCNADVRIELTESQTRNTYVANVIAGTKHSVEKHNGCPVQFHDPKLVTEINVTLPGLAKTNL
jgi:hypothetical protein